MTRGWAMVACVYIASIAALVITGHGDAAIWFVLAPLFVLLFLAM